MFLLNDHVTVHLKEFVQVIFANMVVFDPKELQLQCIDFTKTVHFCINYIVLLKV